MMLPEYSLEGKRVLITGAGRGIGKGIALVMAEAGADVVVTGLTPTGVNRVAEAIAGMAGAPCPWYATLPARRRWTTLQNRCWRNSEAWKWSSTAWGMPSRAPSCRYQARRNWE